MLDTSDREVFNSSYDPSMGTTDFFVSVDENPSIALIFDKRRREFILENRGNSIVYCGLTTDVSPTAYSFRIRPGRLFAMDHYGGIVMAVCATGNSTLLHVTDIH